MVLHTQSAIFFFKNNSSVYNDDIYSVQVLFKQYQYRCKQPLTGNLYNSAAIIVKTMEPAKK